MIRICAQFHNGLIQDLSVSGHSGSAEHGQDLICAGISAISFGLCNALDQSRSDADIRIGENSIEIHVNHPDEKTDIILQTGLIQMKTVEESNEKYITVKQMEV